MSLMQAHCTHISECFLHSHVKPQIACVQARTHFRNPAFELFLSMWHQNRTNTNCNNWNIGCWFWWPRDVWRRRVFFEVNCLFFGSSIGSKNRINLGLTYQDDRFQIFRLDAQERKHDGEKVTTKQGCSFENFRPHSIEASTTWQSRLECLSD